MPNLNPQYQSAFASILAATEQEHRRICAFEHNGLSAEEETDLTVAIGVALISARLAMLPVALRSAAMEQVVSEMMRYAQSAGGSLGTQQIIKLSGEAL